MYNLSNLFFENKNVKLISKEKLNYYLKFCEQKSLSRKIKYETAIHHILPQSIFPEFSNIKENSWNCVHLYHYDHYYAHWLLTQAIDNFETIVAFSMMHNEENKYNHKFNKENLISKNEYQKILERRYKKQSENHIGKNYGITGENHWAYGLTGEKSHMWGRKASLEARKKMTDNLAERWESEDYKLRIKESIKKFWNSENGIAKKQSLSKKFSGKNSTTAKKIDICSSDGSLMFECYGNFSTICKKNNLPEKALRRSYINGGSPIYSSPLSKFRKIDLRYVGWYAIIIG